jgi:hypothetical protein
VNKFFIVCLLSISACAPVLNQHQIEIISKAKTDTRSIVCEGSACGEYWAKAQVWISKHSGYKVQTQTESVIETFGPIYDIDPMTCGFSITKEPVGGGKFKIEFAPRCFSKSVSSRIPEPEDIENAFFIFMETGRDVLAEAGPPMTAVIP